MFVFRRWTCGRVLFVVHHFNLVGFTQIINLLYVYKNEPLWTALPEHQRLVAGSFDLFSREMTIMLQGIADHGPPKHAIAGHVHELILANPHVALYGYHDISWPNVVERDENFTGRHQTWKRWCIVWHMYSSYICWPMFQFRMRPETQSIYSIFILGVLAGMPTAILWEYGPSVFMWTPHSWYSSMTGPTKADVRTCAGKGIKIHIYVFHHWN